MPEISDDDLTQSAMLTASLATDVEHTRRIVRGIGHRIEAVLLPEQRRTIIGELNKLAVDVETLLDELQPERRERDEDD
jgi:hypothetical protein